MVPHRQQSVINTNPTGAYLSLDPLAPVLQFINSESAAEFHQLAPKTTYFLPDAPSPLLRGNRFLYVRAPPGLISVRKSGDGRFAFEFRDAKSADVFNRSIANKGQLGVPPGTAANSVYVGPGT